MNTKDHFIVQGLAGKKSLAGSIMVSGAKNAALKAMAAAVLFDGPVVLDNVPDTADIHTLAEILQKLGAQVSLRGISVEIDPSTITSTDIDPGLAKTMRASVVLTGPMLARFHKISFPSPGGCVIGARPIDLFIAGYAQMGARTDEKDCVYRIESDAVLKSARIAFKKISVGATETLMMAAVLADGTTVLENCAMEPEITNVAEWLNSCGAKISGVGTPTIQIIGTAGKLLKSVASGVTGAIPHYIAIPDRIETGSYLLLGALCAEDLVIKNCRPDHIKALTSILKSSGVPIEIGADSITISGNTRPNSDFKSVADLRTREYPGFATDLQAPMTVFLTQATGQTRVHEAIYEGRFKYVDDLEKMGADISMVSRSEVLVKGPSVLRAMADEEELSAHDIRAGFAIVMAALVADGSSMINNVHLIDRGYERLEERLSALGAKVSRVSK